MAFNAAEFRARLGGKGARPNQFEVAITFPVAPGVAGDPSSEFTFMCQASTVPGMNVGAAETFYFGRKVSFAGDRIFDDWTVQVINDEDFLVRNAFESWSNRMHLLDHDTNQADKIQGQPVYAKAVVRQFGKGGAVIKTYNLENAWPLNVSEMALAWADNDRIQTFDVTFRYDFFTTDKIDGITG